MKKRVFFLMLGILATTNLLYGYNYDFIVDGFFYIFNSSTSVTLTYPVDEEGRTRTYTNLNGELVIPETVEYNGTTYQVTLVGNEAFRNTGITSLTIPNSVTMIGAYSFYGCNKLTSVSIGNAMKTIGVDAFSECTSLTTVNINSANNIMDCAFKGCINLTSLTLPNNLYNISESAFRNCGLQSVTIPDRVSNIASNAFFGCSNLESVSIGKSVTNIDNNAFNNCRQLKHLIWNARNYEKSISNGFLQSNVETIIIGDQVETLPNSFLYASKITSLIIPNSVKVISGDSFSNCPNLTTLSIGTSLETIYRTAFTRCPSLGNIQVATGNAVYDSREGCNAIIERESNSLVLGCKTTFIPTSVKAINELAFSGCTGLTSIIIPASVTKVGERAFSGCTGISKITSQSQRPPVAYDNTFEGMNYQTCTLSVPSGSLQSYWTSTGWNNFENIIEEGSSVPVRGDINGDGKVDIADVNEVIDIMLGKQ